jgi:hypothetical protein
MKSIRLLSLLLLLPLAAYSGTGPFDRNVENTTFLNPACPATLSGVYADSRRGADRVSVHIVNQTEKRVIAVKVGLEGLDATRDTHVFSETYASALSLKPHGEAKPIWNVHDDSFAPNIAGGVRVYLLKLTFSDGSTWEDAGAKSCYLSISGRPKPQPNDD